MDICASHNDFIFHVFIFGRLGSIKLNITYVWFCTLNFIIHRNGVVYEYQKTISHTKYTIVKFDLRF